MATAKLILDKRRKDKNLIDFSTGIDKNKYPLKIRIYQGDDHKEISLNYKFTTQEWIESENRVSKNYLNSGRVNSSIQERYSVVTTILSDHARTIDYMDLENIKKYVESAIDKKINERHNPESSEYIENSKPKAERDLYLEVFGKVIMDRARAKEENKTANWYRDGINAIKNFNKGKDILISDIDITFLENFEAHHISIGNKLNAISAYLRAVRAITNKAVKEILKNKRFENYPWTGGYRIKTEDTAPRPIRINVIEDIRKLKYTVASPEWNARNYMLFMFNNRGMNFIDIAKLTKAQIIDAEFLDKKLLAGKLVYKRSKTDVKITIKLTSEAIKILNYYNLYEKQGEEQVFPIGYQESKSGRATYEQKRKRINKTLTKLASDAGHQDLEITTYTIRYTFGTELRRKGFGLDVVQEALGQKDFRSAQKYTENYEDSVMDSVTEMIVLNSTQKSSSVTKSNGDKRVAVKSLGVAKKSKNAA